MIKRRHQIIPVLFAVLLLVCCSKQPAIEEPKIVVLGLDGLDLDLLQDLIQQNELPAFQQLLEEGAYGELQSYRPMISPLIWTSIATGRMPSDHGILGFSYRQNNNTTISIPSSKRKCAAIWNITKQKGISTSVIGWYATWPSEPVEGVIVSDRFVQSIHVADAGTMSQTLPQVTYPEETAYSLYDFRQEYSLIKCDTLQQFISFTDTECQELMNTPFDLNNSIQHLRLIMARANTYHEVLLHLLDTQPTRLTLALIDCTDTAAHLFMPYHPPKQDHILQEEFERYRTAVTQTYRYADSMVRSVLERLNENDILIVISDHGFLSGNERPVYTAETTEGNAVLWHDIQGTIIAFGGGIQPQSIKDATVMDITPTLLALLGIPASNEMPGNVLPEIYNQEPLQKVEDWDHTFTPPELPETKFLDPIEIERLQALGYSTGSSNANEITSQGGMSVEDHLNLAVFYHEQNQTGKALQEARAAYELNPNHEKVLEHIAALTMENGEYQEALRYLQPLRELQINQYEQALSSSDYNKITAMKQSLLTVYSHLGEAYFQLRQFSQAIHHFEQAVELDNGQPDLLYNLGFCYGITGQYERSIETLERLLKINPDHFKATYSLAVAKLRLNQAAEARELLLSLLQTQTNDPNLYYLMGQCYAVEQNNRQAAEWYNKALQINPNLTKARTALNRLAKE